MDATKAILQQAQAAPEDQRLTLLKDLTGENLTGDLLTATIWGYFANHLFLARLAQTQAQMIDQPGLSYGLFHLAVKPNKLYGIVTTGITVQGLNLDVGHMRYLRWSKTNDKTAWIAYNRMRGQQASALEHATPEEFWIDRKQCRYTDENGQIQNPSLTDCPQAVSAVKALAIAASQGQKIYTITQKNAALALPKLSLSRGVAEEIQNAIAAGKEVTVHEKAINAYGFSGFGYIIIDPETGVGAYLIEMKGNGSFMLGVVVGLFLMTFLVVLLVEVGPAFFFMMSQLGVLLASMLTEMKKMNFEIDWNCFRAGFLLGFAPLFIFFLPQKQGGSGNIDTSKLGRNDILSFLMALGYFASDLYDTSVSWKGCR